MELIFDNIMAQLIKESLRVFLCSRYNCWDLVTYRYNFENSFELLDAKLIQEIKAISCSRERYKDSFVSNSYSKYPIDLNILN